MFVAPCKGGKKETELYWRWVEEVKPPLPRDFRHKFHMTAILLKVRRPLPGKMCHQLQVRTTVTHSKPLLKTKKGVAAGCRPPRRNGLHATWSRYNGGHTTLCLPSFFIKGLDVTTADDQNVQKTNPGSLCRCLSDKNGARLAQDLG